MAVKTLIAAVLCSAVLAGTAAAARGGPVRVVLRSRVIDLYQSAAVEVTGLRAREVQVRLLGATDRSGRAYEWSPYRWRALQAHHGTWRGALPAPALTGIYQLEVRVGHGRKLSSQHWLLRVFARGTMARRAFRTPAAAVRDYVAGLPGRQRLVALRRWPEAAYDHRDPRLHRLFAVGYEPRGDGRTGSRRGAFVTTVRNGFRGRWRVLEVSTQPNG